MELLELEEKKLHEFLGKMVTEMGAAANGALIILGDKLGLYKSLAANGPMSSEQLAEATGTTERYVREWLATQAASTFIEYDAETENFWMTPRTSITSPNPVQVTTTSPRSPSAPTPRLSVPMMCFTPGPVEAPGFWTGCARESFISVSD